MLQTELQLESTSGVLSERVIYAKITIEYHFLALEYCPSHPLTVLSLNSRLFFCFFTPTFVNFYFILVAALEIFSELLSVELSPVIAPGF